MSQSTHRSPAEAPSRWIWPFELLERIGEGGMGVVYRARYVVNDREVAVKMLPADVTSPTVLARFEREMEVLKGLKHANIVRSFGGVCEDKQRFYAMELVEGGSLEDRLKDRGRLSWEQVVEYGIQMCVALSYLHQHGVVHRDVKPANFLISENGQLKLSDFGLASVVASRRITSAGKTAGTLLYMAPEQVRGDEVGPQTDLYALGCVLFELLTGQPPFVGETAAETMHKHCKEPAPRVTQFAMDCPPALEKLIGQLLEKDAEQRPISAREVAQRLRAVTPEVTVVTKPRLQRTTLGSGSDSGHPEMLKATRPAPSASSERGVPLGALLVAIGAAAVLLTWNISLRKQQQRAVRSEQLWVEATRSDHEFVRQAACESLGKLGGLGPEGLNALARGMSDEEKGVRLAATRALGELGAEARSQVPVLLKAKKNDADDEVRTAAAQSVSLIQEDGAEPETNWVLLVTLVTVVSLVIVFVLRRRHSGWIPESS